MGIFEILILLYSVFSLACMAYIILAAQKVYRKLESKFQKRIEDEDNRVTMEINIRDDIDIENLHKCNKIAAEVIRRLKNKQGEK